MNPVEKAVFSLTRAILGNKKARTAFILYACALHLLVVYTTWECALSGSSQDQFQKQPNPFVCPPFAHTSNCAQLIPLSDDTTLITLLECSATGYYTSHSIIYIELHAHRDDHHTIPRISLIFTSESGGLASPLERPGYVGKPTPC